MKLLVNTIFCFLLCSALQAQSILKPGYEAKEYQEMLEIFTQHYRNADSAGKTDLFGNIPSPSRYSIKYRSPELGLKNCWDLWRRKDAPVAVISIRGTVPDPQSSLQNFYAAMVAASGSLQLNDSTSFPYTLARDKAARVHTGWLLGLAHLVPSITEQIKSNYKDGVKEFIITGHSQGAAISYLLRSYLHYQIQDKKLPNDIIFKTYCSAAPKPGNAYYAYDYENITRNGWGLSVVSSLDWVPETPFSIQTFTDISPNNPFSKMKGTLKKQPLYIRWFLSAKVNSIERRTRNAQKSFEHNLGHPLYKQIRKILPQFKEPEYASGNNYQRAGEPITLIPDERYVAKVPDDPNNLFLHHLQSSYYLLSVLENTPR